MSLGSFEINPKDLKLGRELGRGGFGIVYHAQYHGREVAVKKLIDAGGATKEDIDDFRHEVNVMSRVRHPNIVKFIGACVTPPELCIVTEFVSRGSLRDLILNPDVNWEWPLILNIALDAAEGMCALHNARPAIIHRDLKSMNFLVDQNYRVKVADFGLAKVRTFSKTVRSVAGTYMWMAPETMEGRPYDEKVDVYSFGLVLWELVTGELPFQEYPNDLALARAVVDFGARPRIPHFCPQSLADLIQDCWDRNPRRRPSFHQVVERLYNMLQVTRGERFRFEDPVSSGRQSRAHDHGTSRAESVKNDPLQRPAADTTYAPTNSAAQSEGQDAAVPGRGGRRKRLLNTMNAFFNKVANKIQNLTTTQSGSNIAAGSSGSVGGGDGGKKTPGWTELPPEEQPKESRSPSRPTVTGNTRDDRDRGDDRRTRDRSPRRERDDRQRAGDRGGRGDNYLRDSTLQAALASVNRQGNVIYHTRFPSDDPALQDRSSQQPAGSSSRYATAQEYQGYNDRSRGDGGGHDRYHDRYGRGRSPPRRGYFDPPGQDRTSYRGGPDGAHRGGPDGARARRADYERASDPLRDGARDTGPARVIERPPSLYNDHPGKGAATNDRPNRAVFAPRGTEQQATGSGGTRARPYQQRPAPAPGQGGQYVGARTPETTYAPTSPQRAYSEFRQSTFMARRSSDGREYEASSPVDDTYEHNYDSTQHRSPSRGTKYYKCRDCGTTFTDYDNTSRSCTAHKGTYGIQEQEDGIDDFVQVGTLSWTCCGMQTRSLRCAKSGYHRA